jgi:hypothetical protein
MMMVTYLTVTTRMIDQKIRLMTPKICSWSTGIGWWPTKVSLKA